MTTDVIAPATSASSGGNNPLIEVRDLRVNFHLYEGVVPRVKRRGFRDSAG